MCVGGAHACHSVRVHMPCHAHARVLIRFRMCFRMHRQNGRASIGAFSNVCSRIFMRMPMHICIYVDMRNICFCCSVNKLPSSLFQSARTYMRM